MMKTKLILGAALCTIGGGVLGGVITYVAVRNSLARRYEEIAHEEIQSVKRRYELIRGESGELYSTNLVASGENLVQGMLAKASREIVVDNGYSADVDGDDVHETAQTLSIFDQAVDPSELDEGSDEDGPEEPIRVIAEAEYFENDDFEKDTLTYYEADDTLVDERENVIDRVEETVGIENLIRFKPNYAAEKTSLYIRNEVHDTDYEVIFSSSSYTSAVLGLTDDSLGLFEPKSRPRRMRDDD